MVQKLSPSPPRAHVLQIMEHSLHPGISSTSEKHKAFHYNDKAFYLADSVPPPIGSSEGYDEESQEDELFKNFRGFLIFGKLIGLIPFSGVMSHSSEKLSFKRTSIHSITSHVITAILLVNAILGIHWSMKAKKGNALEIAASVRATLYFIWGCYIYIRFLLRSEDFLNIFRAWRSARLKYSNEDKTLRRDVALIGASILTSAILENAVLHLEYIKDLDSVSGGKYSNITDDMGRLEAYYWRSHQHWAETLGYNEFFAVLAFLQHKWILYTWNYMDILIAIFGRAIYYKFKTLNKVAEQRLFKFQGLKLSLNTEILQDHNSWVQIVNDHKQVCWLLGTVEKFFSPLVFWSYAINVYYICMQLLDGLQSEVSQNSIVHSIYAPWSFVHLVFRLLVVSICLARINVYAHQTRSILHECPGEFYTSEVSRLDKRITSGPDIGLTGLGCFVVTKPFILSILSVVFTFELVLLQCVPQASTATKNCCCPPPK